MADKDETAQVGTSGLTVEMALSNVTSVVRAFQGNAEVHEVLSASLALIRAQLARAHEKPAEQSVAVEN